MIKGIFGVALSDEREGGGSSRNIRPDEVGTWLMFRLRLLEI